MRKDHFTEEAVKAAYALAELKYSEDKEDQLRFAEAYDFTTCQRPDGSRYGTRGKCRKGTETSAAGKEELKKTAGEMKVNRGAYLGAKKEGAKAGPHAAQLKELKSVWKDQSDVVKTRKAELDRVTRAFKLQEKKVKEEPTSENKSRLKLVRAALMNEERAYKRAEKEAEKAARAWYNLNKRNERAKMSPERRKEEARLDREIRELG